MLNLAPFTLAYAHRILHARHRKARVACQYRRTSRNSFAFLEHGWKVEVKKFGSSNIVISIDALKDGPNNYYPLYNYGRDKSEYNLVDWLKICENPCVRISCWVQ